MTDEPSDSDPSNRFSRRRILQAVAAGGLLLGTGITVAQQTDEEGGFGGEDDGSVVFEAELSGDNEVPPVTTGSSGTATFRESGEFLRFTIELDDISQVTQGHIHEGEPDENGDIIEDLLIFTEEPDGGGEGEARDFTGDGNETDDEVDGNETDDEVDGNETDDEVDGNETDDEMVDDEMEDGSVGAIEGTVEDVPLIEQIRENPGEYYVNIHTVENPGGEIRGQLEAVEETDGMDGNETDDGMAGNETETGVPEDGNESNS
ncbi:MAG: CHRD domain-containing protein [Halobacteriota archaeon]